MSTTKDRASLLLKLLVSGGLLVYVFGKVGWDELAATLARADASFVLLSFALLPVLVLANVLKWRVLLRAKGIERSVGALFRLALIGSFFNNVLPSNVGGDAVRSFQLGRETGRMDEAVASVFLERVTGLAVLVVLALVSVALRQSLLLDPRIALAVALAWTGCAAVLWLAFDPRPMRWLRARLRLRVLARLAAKVDRVASAIQAYRGARAVWTPVMALSLGFYLLAIVNVYVGCLAFSVAPPLDVVALATPVVLVIAMVPISLGGIGLQEWAYYAVFEHLGIPGSVGLSVALLMRAKALTQGGIGGLLYSKRLLERAPSWQDARELTGPPLARRGEVE